MDILIAKFDYNATDIQELSINKGEKLTLLDDSKHWWKVMNSQNNVGYIPSNHVKRSKQGIFSSLRNTIGRRKGRNLPSILSNGIGDSFAQTQKSPPSFLPDDGYDTNRGISNFNSIPSTCSLSAALPSSVSCLISNSPQSSSSTVPHNGDQCDPLYSIMNAETAHSSKISHDSTEYVAENSWKSHNFVKSGTGTSPSCSVKYRRDSNRSNPNEQNSDSLSKLQKSNESENDPCTKIDELQNTFSIGIRSATNSLFSKFGSMQLCIAHFPYIACNSDELSFQRGDYIQILEKSSDGWWRGSLLSEISAPYSGWFPSNYITTVSTDSIQEKRYPFQTRTALKLESNIIYNDTASTRALSIFEPTTNSVSQLPSTCPLSDQHLMASRSICSVPFPFQSQPTTLPLSTHVQNGVPCAPPILHNSTPHPSGIETVLTLFPFNGIAENGELSFKVDEVLVVLSKPVDDPDWWLCRTSAGHVGLVPRNYVRRISTHSISCQRNMKQQEEPSTPISSLHQMNEMPSGDFRLQFAMRSPNSTRYSGKPWYWGAISRSQGEMMLERLSAPGEFIVRDSESHPGDLTITMNAGDKNRNFKVSVAGERFCIGQKMFTHVDALIEHYKTHPIYKNDCEKHFLIRPLQHPNSDDFLRCFDVNCSYIDRSFSQAQPV